MLSRVCTHKHSHIYTIQYNTHNTRHNTTAIIKTHTICEGTQYNIQDTYYMQCIAIQYKIKYILNIQHTYYMQCIATQYKIKYILNILDTY